MAAFSGKQLRAACYILMNIASATSIVFANKLVLSVYKFHFVYALTLIHTATTMVRWCLMHWSKCSDSALCNWRLMGCCTCISSGGHVGLCGHWVVPEEGAQSEAGEWYSLASIEAKYCAARQTALLTVGMSHAQVLPIAAAFVGYIVFWNLSLQMNTVGFYQLSKILIAPAIIIIEAVWFKKTPTRMELSAVALLCVGVALATVADLEVILYI